MRTVNGLVPQWHKVFPRIMQWFVIDTVFPLRPSRNMWRVERSPMSSQSHGRVINEEENIGSSCIQSASRRRKCCAGSRLGAMFWNSDLISTATLFPRREARERERATQSDRQGGEWVKANSLPLTSTVTIWLLYMRKNPFRNPDTQRHTHDTGLLPYMHTTHANTHLNYYTCEDFHWFYFQSPDLNIYTNYNSNLNPKLKPFPVVIFPDVVFCFVF